MNVTKTRQVTGTYGGGTEWYGDRMGTALGPHGGGTGTALGRTHGDRTGTARGQHVYRDHNNRKVSICV